jgi:hypothetical protein
MAQSAPFKRTGGTGCPTKPTLGMSGLTAGHPRSGSLSSALNVLGLVGEDQVLHMTDGNRLPVGEVDNGLIAAGMK